MLNYEIGDVSFTNHILERFVERTMGKTGQEIKQFLVQNEPDIKNKLLKLYNSSELLWSGKIKEHNFTHFYINKDGWVIVVDRAGKKLITVYKVDLELGSEFNKIYIEKIKEQVENMASWIELFDKNNAEKLEENKKKIEEIKQDNKLLQAKIEYNKSLITNIEEQEKLELNARNIKQQELQHKIEKFIGARVF